MYCAQVDFDEEFIDFFYDKSKELSKEDFIREIKE